MRPISIVKFERCYLASIAVGLLNSIVTLPVMLRTPQVAQAAAMLGPNFFYGSVLFGIIITLLLWYFAARRASVVAKWIITVFFAFGVLSILRNLVAGFPTASSGVLGVVGIVLQGVAVYLLFRPDAVAWFRGADDVTNLDETFR